MTGITAVLLVMLLTLGGIGLYLAMPSGRLHVSRAALVLLAGAAGAVVALLAPLAVDGAGRGWFIVLAVLGLWAGLRVITHKRPVYSALYFILVILSVAGLLVMAQGEFLAAALVIIYAGAILVTYVFVIMLAQQEGGAPARYDTQAREPFLGCLTGFVLLAVLARLLFAPAQMLPPAPLPAETAAAAGTVANVGTQLLTHYVVGMELAGVLLLAAMVGAIAIAQRRAKSVVAEEGE